MATASALSRSGASTEPRYTPGLRMMGGCPLPSLARPSLLHRLDRKVSKIFVHPLGTRLDVCNGHTRSLSVCHLRWWTNANEPRRICKTLYKSDAAPRLEQHIDVTRRIVCDESLTCRQHRDGWQVCLQGRVFNRACSRCTQGDRRCDRVPCQQKHRFLPDTHASMTAGLNKMGQRRLQLQPVK